ncbi:MAG: UDP-N-acetylglucosamine pyrophosphorylase/glucosamine-phosphate N-acetyltransferase [Actinomycetia bacterium]|nr:UDP-N-acetylglucosamine pyrophosphorylase/glucosamine-phosphate N-acetyltransferase [Actinomycetes bacterium]
MTSLAAVILAAGEGKRMRSSRPKPLHLLCGRAMLLHILDRVADISTERAVVVVGFGAERITKKLAEDGPPGLPIDFVEQAVQRGTGDATSVALTAFEDDDDDADVLVLAGDMPLVRAETLQQLLDLHRATDAAVTVLGYRFPDPTGYGRLVRGKDDRVVRIVEQGDATLDELAIDEVNASIYCFKRGLLAPALRRLTPDNSQGEYYLTDVVEVLAQAGHRVEALIGADPSEMLGVNDRAQLAAAEAELRRRTNAAWLDRGVTMVDPANTYIDASVDIGEDVTLFPGTILQGHTRIGARSEIGPDARLVDTVVGADCVVRSTYATDTEVGDGSVVGPFCHLGAGASIPAGTTTGPFYTSA